MHRILEEAYQRATNLLREHQSSVERLAEALLAYETVTGEEVVKILAGVSVEDLRPEPEPEPEAEQAPAPPGDTDEERLAGGEIAEDLPGSPGLSPA